MTDNVLDVRNLKVEFHTDEKRVFASADVHGPYVVKGVRIGTPICEDAWHPDVAETLAETGAEVATVDVFARTSPEDKLRLVTALQANGLSVAMTGDGVNDAPALKQADVGVAMGITGTEVAKSAAKIVVTDDNFATIVGAVQQGRVVYANLKKVILYLFATSMAEVLVLLLALLGGFPLPLAAVQILWINIVTEGTLTVNLVMDPPEGDEMRGPPSPRDDRLLDAAMLRASAITNGAPSVRCGSRMIGT